MSKTRYIKLFSFSVLTLATGAFAVYLSYGFKNPVAGKMSSFIVDGIKSQASGNASIEGESSSESYFSIFNFITNLAPKN